MLEQLINIIDRYNWRHSKIILAVSGGLDSMAMASLFVQAKKYFAQSPYGLAGFDIAVAHCNFHLRAAASDADAALVQEWCTVHAVQYYGKDFDTTAVIEAEGGNIQLVARQLRYDWFETLRKEINYDCIATAHHQQDSVETLLMNFFKGTGMAGLHGILPEQKCIIRPLLPFTKEQLKTYAEEISLEWREDASNEKDDYLRNKVRHHLLPQVQEIFPNAQQSLFDNTLRFAEAEELYRQGVERYRKSLLMQSGKDWRIPLRKLVHCKPLATITYELLKPLGLTPAQVPDVLHMMHSISGHYIPMGNYRLIKDRNFFIITARKTEDSGHILIEEGQQQIQGPGFDIQIKSVNELPVATQIGPNDLYLNADQLTFPLILRPWKEGDYFYPFGMGMKKKKVKKILIDAKVPLHEKEHIWVLEDSKKVVWVCGMRSDERYKVRAGAQKIIHLSYCKQD
ncbi:tRNA lysidine(34) synthetase TilS [Edaphocola aurantiacus]|uniref:tRNA lysidine(34) synthetase TilS n=1 Tax=Edaphocola aurantiacus TaxID=2601682 RepID=UPI001C94058A|nr:tRNA lysidine(34) synthetase TilS [Edaphocola aurantiacus]